jgi:hypothetical protein
VSADPDHSQVARSLSLFFSLSLGALWPARRAADARRAGGAVRVDIRTITNWINEGMPQRSRDGELVYSWQDCREWREAQIRKTLRHSSRRRRRGEEAREGRAAAAPAARRGRAAELDVAERRGELVTVDYMAAEFERIAQSMRAQLLAIPTAWAPVLDKCKTTLDRQLVLRDEVNNILPILGEAARMTTDDEGRPSRRSPSPKEEEERMTSPWSRRHHPPRDRSRRSLRGARSASDRASAFAPKSHLTLSQWSDKYRCCRPTPATAAVAHRSRALPASDHGRHHRPAVRKVSVMKSARIGATQAIVVNTIFYCVDQDPCAIIVGLPTIDDALKFSSKLLQPAIDDTRSSRSDRSEKSKKRAARCWRRPTPAARCRSSARRARAPRAWFTAATS